MEKTDGKKMILIFLGGVLTTLLVVLVVLLAGKIFPSSSRAPEGQTAQQGGGAPQVVDYGPQIEEVKRVLAGNPNDPGALVTLGNLYFDTFKARGETIYARESIRAYEKGLALKPGNPDVMTDMGTMYRDIGQTEKAIETFRKAAVLDPGHATSRLNLGVALWYDRHDAKGAKAAFDEFLRLIPTGPQADNVRELMATEMSQ